VMPPRDPMSHGNRASGRGIRASVTARSSISSRRPGALAMVDIGDDREIADFHDSVVISAWRLFLLEKTWSS